MMKIKLKSDKKVERKFHAILKINKLKFFVFQRNTREFKIF